MNLDFYVDFWKRGLDFKGRSSREEFWYTYLVNFLINLAFIFLAFIPFLPLLQGLYGLAVLIPTLAISVRRLHDSDRTCLPMVILFAVQFIFTCIFIFFFIILFAMIFSFWFVPYTDRDANFCFCGLIFACIGMLIAMIVQIVFMCLPPTQGMNNYGPMREKINFNKNFKQEQYNYQYQNPNPNPVINPDTGEYHFGPQNSYKEQMERQMRQNQQQNANMQQSQNNSSENPYFKNFQETYGQQTNNKSE